MTTILPASHSSALLPPGFNKGFVMALVCLLAGAMAFLLSGCAAVTQSATTTTTQTNGVVSVTSARSSIYALGDAKTVVDKVRASAGKTAVVGVSGVSEEASSSNAVAGVAEIVGAAVRAAVKP